MLKGIGDVYAKTTGLAGGLTAQRMIELFLFEFEFTQESTAAEAQAYIKGTRKTKRSGEASVTSTLTLRAQYLDWAQLGFVLDQFDKTVTSATLPLLKYGTVPTSGPYEIADAAITAGNTNNIFAYINARGAWGQPGFLPRAGTPATPTTGQVGVDTTNSKLIFNAAQAGAPVTYTVPESVSNIKAYGGSGSATKYGSIEFWGRLYSTEETSQWPIYFPELTRQGRPTISLTGDTPTLEIVFSAGVPAGWEEPYQIFNRDTAA